MTNMNKECFHLWYNNLQPSHQFFVHLSLHKSACVHVQMNDECLKLTGFMEVIPLPVEIMVPCGNQPFKRGSWRAFLTKIFYSCTWTSSSHTATEARRDNRNPRRIPLLFFLGATGTQMKLKTEVLRQIQMMDPESFCLSLTYLICQAASMTQKEGCLCSIFPNSHHFLSLCLKHPDTLFLLPLKRHFLGKKESMQNMQRWNSSLQISAF